MSQILPEGKGGVGNDGIQKHHHLVVGFIGQRQGGLAGEVQLLQLVQEFHNGGNGGVKGLSSANVIGDLFDGSVKLSSDFLFGFIEILRIVGFRPRGLQKSLHVVPKLSDKPESPFNAGFLPFQSKLGRGREHHEKTHGVRAVAIHHFLGIDAVVLGLAHLGHAGMGEIVAFLVLSPGDIALGVLFAEGVQRAYPDLGAVVGFVVEGIGQHHALTEQPGEGFIAVHHAGVPEQLVEEAGVEEVHAGVFDAADVLIHRKPEAGGLAVQHALGVVVAAVAGIVPGGFHKGIEGVSFPEGFLTVNGYLGPFRICLDGTHNAVHDYILGEQHRELLSGHHAAVRQVYHGNGSAPVTLSGDAPVSETVVYRALAHVDAFQFVSNGVEGTFEIEAVKFSAVKGDALFGVGGFGNVRLILICGADYRNDVETVFLGEFIITLIMSRHGHYCAGAVIHNNEIGDHHRDFSAVQGVDSIEAGGHALLFHFGNVGFGDLKVAAFLNEFGNLGIYSGSLPGQRMHGSNGHVGNAHEGVGSRGVNLQHLIPAVYLKLDVEPL